MHSNRYLLFLLVLLASAQASFATGSEGVRENQPLEPHVHFERLVKSDPWFAQDKFDHFLFSAFAAGMAYGTLHHNFGQREGKSLIIGASLSFALGLGKEAYDLKSRNGHPSFKDLLADLLGAGCAVFMIKSL